MGSAPRGPYESAPLGVTLLHVDDERLVLVAEKNGAPIGGGHHTLDGDGDDVVLHGAIQWRHPKPRASGEATKWVGAGSLRGSEVARLDPKPLTTKQD